MGEIFTDDGRIVDRELPSNVAGCVDDEVMGNAFLIDSDQQYLAEDGEWHQPLTEKSMEPLSLRQKKETDEEEEKKIQDEIFVEAFEEQLMVQINKAKTNEAWDSLIKIITVVCVTLGIIVVMGYVMG